MNKLDFDLIKMKHTHTIKGFKNTRVFWLKVCSTFFYFPSLWALIIKDKEVDSLLDGTYKESLLRRILRHMFWFWPRLTQELPWIYSGHGLPKDVQAFSEIPSHHRSALDLFSKLVGDKDAPILDLGCNMGRHLNFLYDRGHTSLYGVDIMKKAFVAFQERFPKTYDQCTLDHNIFQRYLTRHPDRSFSGVYTFGATVEYNHPSFALVREVCRVSNDLVMFVINENGGGYTRFWTYEFNRSGFDLIFAIRPLVDASNCVDDTEVVTSLLVYRRK
ncbi:MAG: class I SAM-dependent methyltransferase [Magnetovibrio sp.]|nr:class I SAM-dependent methyltransferase [Magnetovibrio sp.]